MFENRILETEMSMRLMRNRRTVAVVCRPGRRSEKETVPQRVPAHVSSKVPPEVRGANDDVPTDPMKHMCAPCNDEPMDA